MTDRVRLEAELRGVAGDLDDVAGRIRDVLCALRAATAPNEGKWGTDEYGQNFAGGNGYIASAENLEGVMESKSVLLETYSTALRDAADLLQGTDHGNAANI
ncbi:MAG TPA: hypothetical protein VK083_08780 [Nocardia sp.]|uniref:WXG100 family type VII secretion target n=1 Tax=Nocardia TaxID=1817 RepID=UPI002456BE76|nr:MULTISPECIES: hypothetical protein [Nocardia]HLS76867.1 hypothetical protein [Nocardia sp.]